MRSLGRSSSFWLALVTSHFLASPSQVASHFFASPSQVASHFFASPSQVASHFFASPSQVASHFFASPSQVTSHKNSDSSPTRVQVAWLESTPLTGSHRAWSPRKPTAVMLPLDGRASTNEAEAMGLSCADTGGGGVIGPPPRLSAISFCLLICPGPCNNLDPLLKFLYEPPPLNVRPPPLLNPGSAPGFWPDWKVLSSSSLSSLIYFCHTSQASQSSYKAPPLIPSRRSVGRRPTVIPGSHYDMVVDVNQAVDMFSKMHSRRLELASVLIP